MGSAADATSSGDEASAGETRSPPHHEAAGNINAIFWHHFSCPRKRMLLEQPFLLIPYSVRTPRLTVQCSYSQRMKVDIGYWCLLVSAEASIGMLGHYFEIVLWFEIEYL